MLLLLVSVLSLFVSSILSFPLQPLVDEIIVEGRDRTPTFPSLHKRETAFESLLPFDYPTSGDDTTKPLNPTNLSSTGLETRDDDLVKKYAAGGRTTYNRVEGVIDEVPDDDQDEVTVTDKWNVDKPNPEISTFTKYALGSIGIDAGSVNFKEVDAILKSNAQIYFKNIYAPKAGVIVGLDNQAYQNGQRLAPNSWYEVTWSLWKEQCNAENESPSNLRYIIRDGISNDMTSDILDEIAEGTNAKGTNGAGQPNVSHWYPGDDAFYALLQSPNGLGVTKILEKFPNNVGYKQVARISAFFEANWEIWTMWLELKDC